MKYTIEGFQQEVLVQYGLDSVDAIILRYIIDFFNTGKMNHKIIDNRIYFWVLYDSIINDLPILRIKSKIVIARRFNKYVGRGLLKKNTIKGIDYYFNNNSEFSRRGSYTYFSFNKSIFQELEKNKKNTNELKLLKYNDYLKTAHWKKIKKQIRKKYNNQCQICNSKNKLNVHHKTYERKGEELEEDLILLCQSCHKKFHTILED